MTDSDTDDIQQLEDDAVDALMKLPQSNRVDVAQAILIATSAPENALVVFDAIMRSKQELWPQDQIRSKWISLDNRIYATRQATLRIDPNDKIVRRSKPPRKQ